MNGDRSTWDGIAPYPVQFPTIRFEPAESALLIVDMQRYYLDPAGPIGTVLRQDFPALFETFYRTVTETLIPNLRQILGGYRTRGLPIVHVATGAQRADRGDLLAHIRRRFEASPDQRVGTGGLDCSSPWQSIVSELAPRCGEIVLIKTTRSAFTSTGLDSVLRSLRVEHLLVGGVASDGCVHLSALDASDRGYWTALLEDGSATFDTELHRSAISHFGRLWGTVLTTGDVMTSLHAVAASPGSLPVGTGHVAGHATTTR